jgi:hypothetical protein
MEATMNVQTYLNVTARLAYYEAMKNTAPARVEKARRAKRPEKKILRMPKRRNVILLPTEGMHA